MSICMDAHGAPLQAHRYRLNYQDAATRDIKRANFRLIEKELFHYIVRKTEYDRLRDDIINGTPTPEIPANTGPGDPTLSKILRLQTGVMIETARRLAAIEYAVQVVQQTQELGHWELVRKKYFEQRLTNEGIMRELHIGRDTFYRWRKEFVELIADRLGWEI